MAHLVGSLSKTIVMTNCQKSLSKQKIVWNKTGVAADYFEFMCDKGRRPLKDFLERVLGMERAPTTGFRTDQRGVFFDFDRAIRKRTTPLLERSKIKDKHLKEAQAEDNEKRRRHNAIHDKRE